MPLQKQRSRNDIYCKQRYFFANFFENSSIVLGKFAETFLQKRLLEVVLQALFGTAEKSLHAILRKDFSALGARFATMPLRHATFERFLQGWQNFLPCFGARNTLCFEKRLSATFF